VVGPLSCGILRSRPLLYYCSRLSARGPRQLVLLVVEPELWSLFGKVREYLLAHVEQIAFLSQLPTPFLTYNRGVLGIP
jgi:hypothetical protein